MENNKNVFLQAALRQEARQRAAAAQRQEWGILQRNRLVKVIESAGGSITDWMYDALLFNINGLRINQDGKLGYISFYPESKRIINLLRRYGETIKQNFNYITRTEAAINETE